MGNSLSSNTSGTLSFLSCGEFCGSPRTCSLSRVSSTTPTYSDQEQQRPPFKRGFSKTKLVGASTDNNEQNKENVIAQTTTAGADATATSSSINNKNSSNKKSNNKDSNKNSTSKNHDAKKTSTKTNHSDEKPKAGPWVGIDRSQADPLPLASEFDTRPSTRDLIQKHMVQIREIQQQLKLKARKYYDPVRHDELWILRYLLSQKTVAKAVQAAAEFMAYRHELQLDERDIRTAPPCRACAMDGCGGVAKYFSCLDDDAMIFACPDDSRGIVILARLAGFNQEELMKKVSEQEWPFWYFMEWSFQVLDSITRETGRLTKGIRIVDLEGYSLSQNYKPHLDRASENARGVQDQYPQMLASVFVVNAPSFFTWAFKVLKPLLPKRFCEKFDILSNRKHTTKRLLPHLRLEHIPEKFGGTMKQSPYPIAGQRITGDAAEI